MGSFTLLMGVKQLFCFLGSTQKMGQDRGMAKAYEGISALGIISSSSSIRIQFN